MDVSEKDSESKDILDEIDSSRTERSKRKSIFLCIVFGILLGASLGLLSSLITFHILKGPNRPDMLVRRGWEDIHLAMMVSGGCSAGFLYGLIFWLISRKNGGKYLRLMVFLLTMLLAIPVYFAGDYISLWQKDVFYWMAANIFLFGCSLLIAFLLSKTLNKKQKSNN